MGNLRKPFQALHHNYRSSIFNISSIFSISTNREVLAFQLSSQLGNKLEESDALSFKNDVDKKSENIKKIYIIVYCSQLELDSYRLK